MRALIPFVVRIPQYDSSGGADSLATHWSLATEVPKSSMVATLKDASRVPEPVVEKTRYVLPAI